MDLLCTAFRRHVGSPSLASADGTARAENVKHSRAGWEIRVLGGYALADTAPDTDQLLDRAASGDGSAREQLLERHRKKLKRMVAIRLDRRIAARVDPSDVVQE